MTTAELKALCRKYIPEALKAMVEMAETSSCEKARRDAAKELTSRGYVRSESRDGDVLNVTWQHARKTRKA